MSTRFIRNPRLREALVNAYAVKGSGALEVRAVMNAINTAALFMTGAQRASQDMVDMRSEFTKIPSATLQEQLDILASGLQATLFILGVESSDIQELQEQAEELAELPLVGDIELTQLIIKVGYCAVADSNDEEIDILREAVEHAVELLGQRAQDSELAQSLSAIEELAMGDDNDPEIQNLQEALERALGLLGASQDDVQALKDEGERRWDEE